MIEQDKVKIQALCTAKQAIDSKFIDPASIAIAHWVRYKCQYGCSGYGKSLCCPPHAPAPDETKRIVAEYSLGLLVHFDRLGGVTEAIVELERELFLRNYYKAIGFGAGSCKLCEQCSLSECREPKLAPAFDGGVWDRRVCDGQKQRVTDRRGAHQGGRGELLRFAVDRVTSRFADLHPGHSALGQTVAMAHTAAQPSGARCLKPQTSHCINADATQVGLGALYNSSASL